jgi:multidrug transporter EmrE-like cation transporter
MSFVLAIGAAASFTVGGLMMKPAAGMSRLAPTLAFFALFLLGAACTALLVHRGGEVGPAYLIVVGIESVLAFGLSVALFGETLDVQRVTAVGLLLAGTLLLAESGA